MTEQQLAAMRQALEACPFCGGDAEYQKENVRSGYGDYERSETYHTVRCKKCGSSSKRVHQKHLIDFTKYTVRDFRENPILRAKIEDDHDAYCEQSKQLAIDAWNLRTAIKEAKRQQALDKKAENARELGLDYEPVQEPVTETPKAYQGPLPRPVCNCNGWGCWGCCLTEQQIRSQQGTFS